MSGGEQVLLSIRGLSQKPLFKVMFRCSLFTFLTVGDLSILENLKLLFVPIVLLLLMASALVVDTSPACLISMLRLLATFCETVGIVVTRLLLEKSGPTPLHAEMTCCQQEDRVLVTYGVGDFFHVSLMLCLA